MSVEIKIASLPESVEEGTIMTFYKKEGDAVARDEKIADVETDKVVIEIASVNAGMISKLLKKEGDTVVQGDVIAVVEPGAEGKAPSPAEVPAPKAQAKKAPVPREETPPTPTEVSNEDLEAALSPAARKLVLENGLDVRHIMGTGRGGRVTKADILRHIEALEIAKTEEVEPVPPPERVEPKSDVSEEASVGIVARGERRVPMSRIRARIAERLVEAQQTSAILTTFNEVDLTRVVNLRKEFQADFEKAHDVRLGYMSFFTKAAIEALKQFPNVNASIEGSDIIYHDYYDIGMAISSPRGLVVPVLRDADAMSFSDIEQKIVDLAEQAKYDKLSIQDLQGGTFTITNGGIFGSMLSTPILNPPQSGILGMHTIQQRPMAVDGEVKIRPMMYIALSYDHRIIDGRDAVSFLVNIKENLENPSRMLLGL